MPHGCRRQSPLRTLGPTLLVLLGLAPAAPAAAAAGDRAALTTPAWTPIGPWGGRVEALALDATRPGTAYALTARAGGIFRTVDHGASWTALGRPREVTPEDVAVCGGTPWIASAGSLWRWDAEAWRRDSRGLGHPGPTAASVRCGAGGTVYALFGPKLFRRDAGTPSWVLLRRTVRALGVDARDPRRIAIVGRTHLLHSADGGETFTVGGPVPFAEEAVHSLALARRGRTLYAAGVGVHRSLDGGRTWKRVPTLGNVQVVAVTVRPDLPRVVYAATLAHGLYRSNDGGDRWRRLLVDGDARLTDVEIDPQDSRIVWAATGGERHIDSVHRSADGGRTWQVRTHGLQTVAVTTSARDPETPDRFYAAVPGLGLFRRDGASWTDVGPPAAAPPHRQLTAMLVDPHDPATLFAASSEPAALWRSHDRGSSWTQLEGVGAAIAVVADPMRPGRLFAVRQDALLRSLDGGDTWAALLRFGEHDITFLHEVAVAVEDPDRVWASGMRGSRDPRHIRPRVVRSDDGGASWTRVEDPPGKFQPRDLLLDPADADRLWLSTHDSSGLRRTDDGGATWEIVGGGWLHLDLAVDAAGDLWSLAIDPRGERSVLRSETGGATWWIDGDPPRWAEPLELVVAPQLEGVAIVGTGVFLRD